MAEADIFEPDGRVEPIDGEVFEMAPIGVRHLVIEVSDTSLRHDLDLKTPLYIAGSVPEVWVVDLVSDTLRVTRGGQTVQLPAGDSVAPAAFPDLVLEVADILGRVG